LVPKKRGGAKVFGKKELEELPSGEGGRVVRFSRKTSAVKHSMFVYTGTKGKRGKGECLW